MNIIIFKDKTSILKGLKKVQIKKTLAPLKDFKVFDTTFIESYEISHEKKLLIKYLFDCTWLIVLYPKPLQTAFCASAETLMLFEVNQAYFN